MRILIVDDERPARDKLRRLLAAQADVSAVEEARDGKDALTRLTAFRPDAIFLDVQMPEMDGLELATALPAPAPVLVFVTAFDEYALRAFDANAIDYLLKPYDEARFARALQRVRERLGQPLQAPPHLLLQERGRTQVIPTAEIGWLEAADNYVVIHHAGKTALMRQTLAGLCAHLGAGFLRCQRSAAVALAHIAAIDSLAKGDAELLLRDGSRVPCSRQYRAEIEAALAALASNSPQA